MSHPIERERPHLVPQAAAQRLTRSEQRVAASIFLLSFVIYAMFFAGGGWGQNSHFALTRAMVEDRSFAIDRFADSTGDVIHRGGHVYSNKLPGLSLWSAIPYGAAYAITSAMGVDINDPVVLTLVAWLCTIWSCALPAALVPMLLFVYARGELRHSTFYAALGALLFAFATPWLPYSTLYFVHVPSGALLFLAWWFARGKRGTDALVAGACVGAASIVNYLAIPVVAVIGTIIALRSARERFPALVRFVLGMLPFGIAGLVYQLVALGGAFRISGAMNEKFLTPGALFGLLVGPRFDALIGITVSPYRGLFYLAPVLLFAFGGAVLMMRRRKRLDFWSLLAIVLVFFAFNVSFNNWEAGFAIGPRYLITIVPFLWLFVLEIQGRMRIAIAIFAIVSFANVFAATAVDPQPSGSIADPLRTYIYPLLLHGRFTAHDALHPAWSPALMTGHTSVVRQTIDQAIPFQKYPPDALASTWASFNMGELLTGPGELGSILLPLAIIVLGGAAILVTARRSSV